MGAGLRGAAGPAAVPKGLAVVAVRASQGRCGALTLLALRIDLQGRSRAPLQPPTHTGGPDSGALTAQCAGGCGGQRPGQEGQRRALVAGGETRARAVAVPHTEGQLKGRRRGARGSPVVSEGTKSAF